MVAEGNVGVAFGLVAAAGMATCLGACIVFCASLAQPRFLAASLGFAAGVMLYVSFAEILMRKSVAGFQAVSSDASGNESFRWSTLCFFGGMLLVAILDKIVHAVAHLSAHRSQRKAAAQGRVSATASTANLLTQAERTAASAPQGVAPMRRGGSPAAADAADPPAAAAAAQTDGASTASVDEELGSSSAPAGVLTEPCDAMTSAVVAASCPDAVVAAGEGEGAGKAGGAGGADGEAGGTTSRTPPAVVEIMECDHHAFMLKKMGLLTAMALFVHNLPEGLATFVGALADTKVGVGLAVAIALHNIPEGICVAMPIYYATGSRWKGFMWAFLSGVSEPVGGVLGYVAVSGNSDLAFAIVFGIVAGMMVYISIKELIPTALRYDPQDTVTTTCVVAGMVVMAASLLLFTL